MTRGLIVLAVLVLVGVVETMAQCTLPVSDIMGLETAADDTQQLEGRWFVTHVFGSTSEFTSYTADIVPTQRGITIYMSSNQTVQTQCIYTAFELNSTSDPGRFVTSDSPSMTLFASSNHTDYAVLYLCDGTVSSAATDTCNLLNAFVTSRQLNATAAGAWFQGLGSVPCLPADQLTVVTQGPECKFKTVWGLPGRDCVVANFPVQENFSLQQYAGVWWEMSWLAPFYIPDNELFVDYYHNYTINPDGNMTCDITGRSPQDGQCFYNQLAVLMTDTPGKMIFNESAGPNPYNVIFTDYTHYAVVAGCREVDDVTGRCSEAGRAWVWSRDVTLSRARRLAANSLLQDVCFNPAAFLATAQVEDCKRADPSGPTGGSSFINGSSVLVIAFFLLSLLKSTTI